ncbi:MAG: hypothetical protein Q9207_000141 [Kuettlingeria erythrocarpa]
MCTPLCPFCPFSDPSPYFLAQHIERLHPEPGEPSFVSRHFLEDGKTDDIASREATTGTSAPSQNYLECECGEAVLLSEFDDHVQLHSAESADMAVGTTQLPVGVTLTAPHRSNNWLFPLQPEDSNTHRTAEDYATPFDHNRGTEPTKAKHHVSYTRHDKQNYTVKGWIDFLLGSSPTHTKQSATQPKDVRRLGKAELGPYAHEDQMPAWLYKQLERGAKVSIANRIGRSGRLVRTEVIANETPGVLPVLAQLCQQDQTLSKVYLCHPGVQHVFKMAKEGGFCGYRNIQMMLSYIQTARAEGYEYFPGRVPSILDLQELIESAWDRGINSAGKIETGGIRGTRKYIGTPEVRGHELPRYI